MEFSARCVCAQCVQHGAQNGVHESEFVRTSEPKWRWSLSIQNASALTCAPSILIEILDHIQSCSFIQSSILIIKKATLPRPFFILFQAKPQASLQANLLQAKLLFLSCLSFATLTGAVRFSELVCCSPVPIGSLLTILSSIVCRSLREVGAWLGAIASL